MQSAMDYAAVEVAVSAVEYVSSPGDRDTMLMTVTRTSASHWEDGGGLPWRAQGLISHIYSCETDSPEPQAKWALTEHAAATVFFTHVTHNGERNNLDIKPPNRRESVSDQFPSPCMDTLAIVEQIIVVLAFREDHISTQKPLPR